MVLYLRVLVLMQLVWGGQFESHRVFLSYIVNGEHDTLQRVDKMIDCDKKMLPGLFGERGG